MAAEEMGEWRDIQSVPIGGRGQVDVLVSDKGTIFFMKLYNTNQSARGLWA
jgi:hypothetical protein